MRVMREEKIIGTVEKQLISGMTTFNIIEINETWAEKKMVTAYMDGGQPYKKAERVTTKEVYYKIVNSSDGYVSRYFETKEELDYYLK